MPAEPARPSDFEAIHNAMNGFVVPLLGIACYELLVALNLSIYRALSDPHVVSQRTLQFCSYLANLSTLPSLLSRSSSLWQVGCFTFWNLLPFSTSCT